MKTLNRRRFLRGSALATVFGLAGSHSLMAIEPFKRSGAPRFPLSLAAYSFRNFFKESNNPKQVPPDPNRVLDMFKFVDYCADQALAGAEVTSYYFPKPPTTDFLIRLKRHAFMRGIVLSGTSVGNNFARPKDEVLEKEIADVKKWIDYAAIMGAPHIRLFAGPVPKQISRDEARKNCIQAIEECCEYAGTKGIILGLENHGGIVDGAAELLEIIKAVKSDWLGINLDTGNFHSDDPYKELADCAPYAVNVQIKGELKRKGAAKPETADLARINKILRDANYQGFVALEYEMAEDPWTAVPRWLKQMKEVFNPV